MYFKFIRGVPLHKKLLKNLRRNLSFGETVDRKYINVYVKKVEINISSILQS